MVPGASGEQQRVGREGMGGLPFNLHHVVDKIREFHQQLFGQEQGAGNGTLGAGFGPMVPPPVLPFGVGHPDENRLPSNPANEKVPENRAPPVWGGQAVLMDLNSRFNPRKLIEDETWICSYLYFLLFSLSLSLSLSLFCNSSITLNKSMYTYQYQLLESHRVCSQNKTLAYKCLKISEIEHWQPWYNTAGFRHWNGDCQPRQLIVKNIIDNPDRYAQYAAWFQIGIWQPW